MKKKFQVFISSTYLDLVNERQSAVQAVLDAGHIPAGMELFKAGNESQLETIKKWIDDSDVYMLILGGRYGSIEEGSGKSYIQIEYEYAIENEIPVFAVVLKEDFLNRKAVDSSEVEFREQKHIEEYELFKSLVKSKIVREVDDEKDIQLAIHATLNEFFNTYDLVGWVRGENVEANAELLSQINELNKEHKRVLKLYEEAKSEIEELRFEGESDLAFEGDLLEIVGLYKTKQHSSHTGTRTRRHKVNEQVAWDDLFFLWAPRLFAPLNVHEAKSELEAALRDHLKLEGDVRRNFQLNSNQFQLIKVQFHALGLINALSVESTGGGAFEFIVITAKGKQYLTKSMAVKRSDVSLKNVD